MNLWWIAVFLQILDYLTTNIFLDLGLHEANPLIFWYIKIFGSTGLLLGKVFALIFILVAYKTSNPRAVVWSNYFCMVLILWNVVAISMAPQLIPKIYLIPG